MSEGRPRPQERFNNAALIGDWKRHSPEEYRADAGDGAPV